MIFLMSLKQWKNSKKKLVLPKDYIIFDATEDDDAYMSKFTNTVTMDGFNPPRKLVKLASKEIGYEDDIIDYDKFLKLEKEFFNGLSFKNAVMATISGLVENGDINIFIVLQNKVFKLYKKKMKKVFKKMFPVSFEFITIFSGEIGEHKGELRYTFSKDEIAELREVLRSNERALEKHYQKKNKGRR